MTLILDYAQARMASDSRCTVLQERCDALQERCDMLSSQREELLATVGNAENDAASALSLLEDERILCTEAQVALRDLDAKVAKQEEELLVQGSRIEELTAQEAKWNGTNDGALAAALTHNRELETALKEALQRYDDLNQDHSAAILEHEAELRKVRASKDQIESQAQPDSQQTSTDESHIEEKAVEPTGTAPSQPTASPSGSAKPLRATPTPTAVVAPPTIRQQAGPRQMTMAPAGWPTGQPVQHSMSPYAGPRTQYAGMPFPGGMRR